MVSNVPVEGPSAPSVPGPEAGATQARSPSISKLRTAHGHFLLPPTSAGLPSPSVLLRGVNLSSASKFPVFESQTSKLQQAETREQRDKARLEELGWRSDIPAKNGWWDDAERGGREGWFVGRPIKEEDADVHFMRLKSWGFTAIRWVIPWESLEHTGPGKYDELYIEYTIRIMRKAKSHGFRVYISSHQDVFSRFFGGSGAPYWVLEACGINPRRVHQTGSAVLQSQWKTEGFGGEEGRKDAEEGEMGAYPDMIWNSNSGRLAVRHCTTMFWASGTFAPKCKIDGEAVGDWLQRHFVGAFAHLAKRIAEAGDLNDDCLIGWDSINEPHEGFIEIPDLNEIPESQAFRKGPSPSPLQAFQLGIGRPVSNIENADFGSLGLKKQGVVSITPPGAEGVWLTRREAEEAGKRWGWAWGEEWDFWDGEKGGCVWAGHGVWDPASGKIVHKDHFSKRSDGGEYDFIDEFWKSAYTKYITAIKKHHPDAIALVNPPIFARPPNLGPDSIGNRVALSSHFYDGLTMMSKRRHLFNADTVGIQRGLKSIVRAVVVGDISIRNNFRAQLDELSGDASKSDGIGGEDRSQNWPTIIGETGIPWNMKETNALLGMTRGKSALKDYAEPAKAMDQLLSACDGQKALSYTLWDYEPLNSHEYGDGWNGEDLSLFSYSELDGDDDLAAMAPKDLSSLIMMGARGLQSWCRPYPVETTGNISKFNFNCSTGKFELALRLPALEEDPLVDKTEPAEAVATAERVGYTKVYLPYAHYLACDPPPACTTKAKRLLGEPDAEGSEWVSGRGPARVDLKVSEISEGTLDVHGQWGIWRYPLHSDTSREVRLVLKPWRGH